MDCDKLIKRLKEVAQDSRRICEGDEIFADDILDLLGQLKGGLLSAKARLVNIGEMCRGRPAPYKDIHDEAYYGVISRRLDLIRGL